MARTPLRLLLLPALAAANLAATPFDTRPALASDLTWADHAAEDLIPGEFSVEMRPESKVRVGASGPTALSPGLSARLDRLGVRTLRPSLRVTPAHDGPAASRLKRRFILTTTASLAEVQAELAADPDVLTVLPRTHMRALTLPNDTWFPFQWDMRELDIETVRTLGDGAGVTVAVVDSGVTPGGADGFPHLLQGWDFIGDDEDASDDDAMVSGLAHGTHVSGTIAQSTDNTEGVVGLAPGVGILPVRVLHYDDPSGAVWGDTTDIAAGIIWAVDHGASVINMSLGSSNRADEVADACTYATENGVLVVASSGNDGNPDHVLYPAALPNVLAVGAVGHAHNQTPYSNGGAELDLVAPGGENTEDRDLDGHDDGIVQESITEKGWRYVFEEGTSMAAPHVSAAAALLFAQGWTTPEEVAEVLIRTATDFAAPGWDSGTGYGQVNIVAALEFPVDPGALAGSGPVVISNVAVDYDTDGMAWVTWNTDVASTTSLSGPDVDVTDPLPVHLHAVRVEGTPGFGFSVDVTSATPEDEASEAVDLAFPLPSDNPFAGCGSNTALAAPGILGLLSWRRLRRRSKPVG